MGRGPLLLFQYEEAGRALGWVSLRLVDLRVRTAPAAGLVVAAERFTGVEGAIGTGFGLGHWALDSVESGVMPEPAGAGGILSVIDVLAAARVLVPGQRVLDEQDVQFLGLAHGPAFTPVGACSSFFSVAHLPTPVCFAWQEPSGITAMTVPWKGLAGHHERDFVAVLQRSGPFVLGPHVLDQQRAEVVGQPLGPRLGLGFQFQS